MARRTVTILSDDLDGKETGDIQTVSFAYNGASYEIDLSKKNRKSFDQALAPYLDAARKAPAPRGSRRSSTRAATVTSADREWLRANGFPDVKDRGRLSQAATQALAER